MGNDHSSSACTTTPFGLHLVGPGEPLAAEARGLEAAVFQETFGNTRDMLDAEYAPFDDVSVFIVVLDNHRGKTAGMIRLTVDGHGTLKSMADIERDPWRVPLSDALGAAGLDDLDPSQVLDVTTLAVDPEYRSGSTGGLVSMSLYAAVTQTAKAGGFRWLASILDVVVLDLINSVGYNGFKHYPGVEPLPYLDSPASVPVWADLVEHEPLMRRAEPDLAAVMFDGAGLEAAVAPGDYARGGELARALSSTGVIDLRDPLVTGIPADEGSQASRP